MDEKQFTLAEANKVVCYLEDFGLMCEACGSNSWSTMPYTDSLYTVQCDTISCRTCVSRDILRSDQFCLSTFGRKTCPNPADLVKRNTNKLDHGKLMAGVLEDFLPVLHEVAKLGSMNNKPNGKYDRGSWMLVENGEQRYLDAFWRHILSGRTNVDPETGMPHSVAIAWNALALVWFQLRREGKI